MYWKPRALLTRVTSFQRSCITVHKPQIHTSPRPRVCNCAIHHVLNWHCVFGWRIAYRLSRFFPTDAAELKKKTADARQEEVVLYSRSSLTNSHCAGVFYVILCAKWKMLTAVRFSCEVWDTSSNILYLYGSLSEFSVTMSNSMKYFISILNSIVFVQDLLTILCLYVMSLA